MNWVIQYIRESQAEYPTISKTPAEVMEHLLFTIGNGYEIKNGNFYIQEKYKKEIPLNELIEKQKTKEKWEEYYNSYKGMFSFIEDFGESEDDYIREQFKEQYDKLVSVDNYTEEELKTKKTWSKIIKKMEYIPLLQLSSGHHDFCQLNEKTDKKLLEISIPFAEAMLDFYKKISKLSEEELKKTGELVMEYKYYKNSFQTSIEELEKDLKKLKS